MKTYIILGIVLLSILLAGCQEESRQLTQRPAEVPKVSPCDQLQEDFVNNLGKGMATPEDLTVGATLLNISGPVFHKDPYNDNPPDYHYTLTFQAKEKIATFRFYAMEQIVPPLEQGKFYSFNLRIALGAILSSGPHNSFFSEKDLDMFEEVEC